MAITQAPADVRREFDNPVAGSIGFPTPDQIRTKDGVPGGEPWTFTQLAGSKKTITLSGWAAPFGRARKSPVATTAIEIRTVERRYPGNDLPTRHNFGVRWDDIELHGRWMDKWGGRGFAKAKTEEMQSFINDQQRCRIGWGNTLSVVGILKRLEAATESPSDVAWKLTILVDSNDSLKPTLGPVPSPKSPGGLLNQIIEALSDSTNAAQGTPAILRPTFADTLDTLVQLINAPGAALLQLAIDVSSFKDATFAELARFRAVLQQYRQALQIFRNTYEQASVEAAIEFARADDELALYRQQAIFGATMAAALEQIADADRQAARAQRLSIKALARAVQGDTWETISLRGYGTADRANDIRDANAVPAGQQPVPGGDYILPV